MQTFCDEIDTDVEGRPAHAARVLENKPSQQGGDLGLTGVNAFYDLGLEMAIGDQREGTKSVKQEYMLYITQELSKADRTSSSIGRYVVRMIYVTIADGSSQVNGSTYPTLFAMAMDYLPIQASSVPCEHIFSSSSETDTK